MQLAGEKQQTDLYFDVLLRVGNGINGDKYCVSEVNQYLTLEQRPHSVPENK